MKLLHYGLKLSVSKFSNFPLLNPSQIAPKIFCLVEQCRTKIPPGIEAYKEQPYVKIFMKECEEKEYIGFI